MTYLHGHQVEVVVINYKRPDNVAEIVRTLKRQTMPCTVTVCDCHDSEEFSLPSRALPYIDRIYRWRHNFGSYNRFVPMGAYDHRYTFFLDDDLLPGNRCVEHFWQHAEQLRAFGALGQVGRIVAADGEYRPQDIPRGPGFTEVDILVRAFFVPTEGLIYMPQIRAMLGESGDPEDDILLAVGLAMQAGLGSYLTPADPDPETLINQRELASPHARYARPAHRPNRSRLLRSAVGLGWQPIRARQRHAAEGDDPGAPAGGRHGVLYLATGAEHRALACASISSLRRYGYRGPVRVLTDQPGWLPPELQCEQVLLPGTADGLASRHYKTQLAGFAYDLTLFLDADAIPVGDISGIWALLGDGDMAMAADAHRSIGEAVTMNRLRERWKEEWGDEYRLMVRLGLAGQPYFNSGVILFRRTDAVARLFDAWHQEWQRYGKRDQMALVRAVALTATRVRVLPQAWNCQPRHFASIRDAQKAGIRILHFLFANRAFMTPRLLGALSDRDRYPEGGDWEWWGLNTKGQRFGLPDGEPGRAIAAQAGGGFAVRARKRLEMVLPGPLEGVHHYWRDQDAPLQSWHGPLRCCQSIGQVAAVSLARAGRGVRGSLHMVLRAGDKLAHYWREPAPSRPWHGPDWIADGVAGNPSLSWSSRGREGCLELVVPRAAGGLTYLRRDQGEPGQPWSEPAAFACELGQVDAVALVQSALGQERRLELIVRAGRELAHYWRPAGQHQCWHGPHYFFTGAAGTPSMVQNSYGRTGGFELLTPLQNGGLAHLWRDNDEAGRPWQVSAYIDRGGPAVEAVSLLPGNVGDNRPGDLVAVVRRAGQTRWYWRQDRLRGSWLSVSLW
jgi:Glycosyl transferase family 8